MAKQMTVRLSDETTTYIDSLVAEGRASSRAAALDRIVRKMMRRVQAELDLERYALKPETEDEREFVAWGSANAADIWKDLD